MNHKMSITETECQPSLSGSNRLGKQSLFIYTLLYIPASSSSSSVISNSKCRLWSQWSWICRLFSRSSLLSCFCWVLKSPKRTGGHKGRESINHWSLWGWIFFSNSHNHFIMVLLLVSGKMVMLLDIYLAHWLNFGWKMWFHMCKV